MRMMDRTWAEIDLDALDNNIKEINKVLKPGVKVVGVVKADAYGNGVMATVKILKENGVTVFAVSCVDEAIQLRENGIDDDILILGNSLPMSAMDIVKFDIIPAVFQYSFAKILSDEAALQNKTVRIHIKLDTGMSRIGYVYDESEENQNRVLNEIERISKLPNLEIDGIFTHFAVSDIQDKTYTKLQYKRFCDCVKKLEQRKIYIKRKHVCNSAGIIDCPDMQLDMVRPGIIIYGYYPSDKVDKSKLNLMPLMQFKTRVTCIKEILSGVTVSYGRTYKAHDKVKIATIGVGYADGYSRGLSNKGEVLVNGQRCKIVGRICMDQCMIDVTDVNNINIGDEVVLFGRSGDDCIPIERIAEMLGTIQYEVSCDIGKRVPRVYLRHGKIVGESKTAF